jgi:hypothetical protein
MKCTSAVLVTLLAHPRDDEQETARSRLHASLCACVLKDRSGDDDITLQSMKPIHAFRDLKDIDADLRTLKNRIQDRMAAARIAIAFLQEAAGQRPKLPPGIKRLSLNHSPRWCWRTLERTRRRMWKRASGEHADSAL